MGVSRRGFLGGLTALVGGILLEEAIPFGRVWSFPSTIVIPRNGNTLLTIDMITQECLKVVAEITPAGLPLETIREYKPKGKNISTSKEFNFYCYNRRISSRFLERKA
jgi:hypothetical protein